MAVVWTHSTGAQPATEKPDNGASKPETKPRPPKLVAPKVLSDTEVLRLGALMEFLDSDDGDAA